MSELIDVLLDESELMDDAVLRELLGELEREATAVRPMPSAELSQLMTARPTTSRRPSFARRGAVITGIAVIGALGLGASAAAASPEARSAIGAGIAIIAHLFDPPTATTVSVPMVGADSPEPSRWGTPFDRPTPSSDATGAPDATNDPTPDATDNPSPAATSEAQNSDESSGDSHGNGKHGNGKGNQSGHGNSRGQGNGGPAPIP